MRIPRPASLLGAAATLAVGTLMAASPVDAAVTPLTVDKVNAVVESIGDAHTAGSYLDTVTGKLVVNVTDAKGASAATAAGATVRVVSRSTEQLSKIQSAADQHVVGTAWSIDPMTNQVLVSVDESVSAGQLAALRETAAASNGAIRLEQVSGKFSLTISGGDAIYGGQYRCSLGFNVRSGSTYYFLTAGHCGNIASTWYSNSGHTTVLGTVSGSSFPGNDYAIVRYTNTTITKSGTVGSQDITSAGTPAVNQTVTRRGSTTGIHTGRVTALNATVNYAEGTVTGLIRTTVCAEGGDSGGPLYQGTVAYGLTSGGSGNCTSGGTTFFQPVTEALSRYGVSVF